MTYNRIIMQNQIVNRSNSATVERPGGLAQHQRNTAKR